MIFFIIFLIYLTFQINPQIVLQLKSFTLLFFFIITFQGNYRLMTRA